MLKRWPRRTPTKVMPKRCANSTARLAHRARGTDFNRAYRKLPTNATTRACIEIAPDAAGIDGDFGFQPDLHPIARVIGTILSRFGAHRQNLTNVVDDPLGEKKPG